MPSKFGKKGGKKSHMRCRRCGRRAYHIQKKVCAACGFGESKRLNSYSWSRKPITRSHRIV
ncbi:MAG: 50S ribosomal protein L37e [Candidatus Bathyarchaeia archaeon]